MAMPSLASLVWGPKDMRSKVHGASPWVHEKLEIVYGGYPKLWYPQQKHWEKPPVRYSLSLFGATTTSLGKARYISSPSRQNHHSEDSNSGHLWVRLGTKVMQKHSKNTIFRGHIIWDLYSLSVQDVSWQQWTRHIEHEDQNVWSPVVHRGIPSHVYCARHLPNEGMCFICNFNRGLLTFILK